MLEILSRRNRDFPASSRSRHNPNPSFVQPPAHPPLLSFISAIFCPVMTPALFHMANTFLQEKEQV